MSRLEPGAKAPVFTLLDDHGTKRRLADFAGAPLLLYVYPAAMTSGCTKQACDFRDNLALFEGADIQVVGLSPDSVEKLARFRDKEHLTFPLLSDPEKKVMEKYGAFGEKQLYGKTVVGVIRSTFLIDAKGRIELAMYGVKATGHVARLVRELSLDAS